MSKINFLTVKVGNSLSTLNENFQRIKDELQNKVLYRDNPVGEPNALENDVDANGNEIFNLDSVRTDRLFLDGQEISVGAADSGGVGFRILRIPN